VSSTPSNRNIQINESGQQNPEQINLSARRGSKIDAKEIQRARLSVSPVKNRHLSLSSQTLVDIVLPVDVSVTSREQIYLRFLGNPNVVVVCDYQHPVTIPKGSKVQMDGNRLRLTDVSEVRGCLVLMNGKKVRFKDAPCQGLPNQEFLFCDNVSGSNLNSSNQSTSAPPNLDPSIEMIINDATNNNNLEAPSGKLISDNTEAKPALKAA
jgi:hypothetical protein